MNTSTPRRALLTAGTMGTVLFAAACGSQVSGEAAAPTLPSTGQSTAAPTTDVHDPGTSTSESTGSAGSEGTSESTSQENRPTGTGGPADGDVAAFQAWMQEGMADVDSGRASITLDANGRTMSEVEAAFVTSERELWMRVGLPGTGAAGFDMTYLVVGDQCWLGGDALLEQLGVTGGEWVEMDDTHPVLSTFADACRSDAWTENVGVPEGGFLSVEDLGPADVDGVEARHFKVALDPSALGGLGGMDLPSQAPTRIPADVYLDEDGRLVLLSYDFSVQGQEFEATMRMFDYDTAIEIEAPDPADVGSLPG